MSPVTSDAVTVGLLVMPLDGDGVTRGLAWFTGLGSLPFINTCPLLILSTLSSCSEIGISDCISGSGPIKNSCNKK